MGNQQKLKICDWNAIHDEIDNLYKRDKTIIKKEKRYFHYTTPDAVLGIFKDYIDGGCVGNVLRCDMRATHLRFLNDAKEYNDGVQWIKNKLKKNSDCLYDQIYSISFCGEGDLLSQWKWYGKNSGIAIEFDADNISYGYWECAEELLPNEDKQTKPLLIRYADNDKSEYYQNIQALNDEQKLNRNSDKIIANLLVPFCKDKGFKEEKESRLVFYTFDGSEYGINFKIKYYVSNGVIKPTLDVKFISNDSNKNIVKSFMVGPGQNQNLVFNALIHIFDRNEFNFDDSKTEHMCKNGIVISKSSIPFRG